jgi:hypothetical protein
VAPFPRKYSEEVGQLHVSLKVARTAYFHYTTSENRYRSAYLHVSYVSLMANGSLTNSLTSLHSGAKDADIFVLFDLDIVDEKPVLDSFGRTYPGTIGTNNPGLCARLNFL